MTPSQGESDTDDNDLRKNGRIRRRPLDNPARIRREVSRLIWDWRAGVIPAEDAARMAGVLRTLHLMIVGPVLEQRLAALEQKLSELGQP